MTQVSILKHKNIFLQHLQAESGPEVGVPALVLGQVIRSHEGLVTEPADKLLDAGVNPLVAGQLITPDMPRELNILSWT